MKSYVFKVVVEDDEHEDGRKAFSVCCPALEHVGAVTWGDTREEALKNIGEVLHMIVEEFAEEGKEIPTEALIAESESSAVVVSV
ncbi:MAG: type II toxin-antitoxin system HicB family antitoxin [Acidobacteria bacterium]|nr:type II toxin-antitoxin system HicB family antitoxin [Acidobacteriota bacterium]